MSRLPISSSCARRCPRISVATAAKPRLHTESDLQVFLRWCTGQNLDPLAAARVDIEQYLRWLQDVRCYQPSTVSRRPSIVVGFYQVRVIDGLLARTRRPTTPADRRYRPVAHPRPRASAAREPPPSAATSWRTWS
jgi:hypothetical protein